MEIKKADYKDALGVAKVQVESWKTTYKNIVPDEYLEQMTYKNRREKWEDIISKQTVFVAKNNKGEIIGFSNAGKERTGKFSDYEGELYAIYILNEYQGKGIGKLLLKSVFEYLKENKVFSMMVWVLENNKSRLFYEHYGAKIIDRTVIEINGKSLKELAYGWKDITEIN